MYGVEKLRKKIGKVITLSVIIGFCLNIALMMVNAIMGVFIELKFYFWVFVILTAGFTMSLTLFDSKKIFTKNKAKKVKVIKQTKNNNRIQKQTKRKIS